MTQPPDSVESSSSQPPPHRPLDTGPGTEDLAPGTRLPEVFHLQMADALTTLRSDGQRWERYKLEQDRWLR